MKFEGTIQGISLDWKSRLTEVVLHTNAKPEDLEALREKKLSVDLKVFRQRRSKQANAFYWEVVTKIAGALGETNPNIHNRLLRQYGQLEILNDKAIYVVLPNTEEVAKQVDDSQTYHLYPTDDLRVGKGGLIYRTYMMIRGSHTYNTKEMSRLIDGAIWMAKEEAGIVIDITDQEKKEMMERYGEKFTVNTKE